MTIITSLVVFVLPLLSQTAVELEQPRRVGGDRNYHSTARVGCTSITNESVPHLRPNSATAINSTGLPQCGNASMYGLRTMQMIMMTLCLLVGACFVIMVCTRKPQSLQVTPSKEEQDAVHKRAAIEALPTRTLSTDENGGDGEIIECSICLSDFERGQILVMLPCRHEFHHECILQWFQPYSTCSLRSVCPLCKRDALHIGESKTAAELTEFFERGHSLDADATRNRLDA